MVSDKQYSLFTVLVSISKGTKQRPTRQPDESVLFMGVGGTVRRVTTAISVNNHAT